MKKCHRDNLRGGFFLFSACGRVAHAGNVIFHGIGMTTGFVLWRYKSGIDDGYSMRMVNIIEGWQWTTIKNSRTP